MKATPTGLEPPGVKKKRKSREVLTWREETFVNAYVENDGNASLAYRAVSPSCTSGSARAAGCEYLAKANIQEAIALRREAVAKRLDISREKLLRAYAGIAFAKHQEFNKVLQDPGNKANYKGLGDSEYAIKSIKRKQTTRRDRDGAETDTDEGEIVLCDRLAALNELWDKLGIDKGDRPKSWADGLEELIGAIGKSQEPGK